MLVPSLPTDKRPSAAAFLRLALVAVNLVFLGVILGVLHGLFRPGSPTDPIPAVSPTQLALESATTASEFGDLIALVGVELDAPRPEPEPEAASSVAPPSSPLAGWAVIALLQGEGQPTTAILGHGGRQRTIQEGDDFLDGEVEAIDVGPKSGQVTIRLSEGGSMTAVLAEPHAPTQ